MSICIACGKKEAIRTVMNGVKTECGACYRDRNRKGYSKKALETSDTIAELALKVTKESAVNIYDESTMKDMMKPVTKVRMTKIGNEVITITESDPMSFFNKKTEDYNMMNGDKEMMKKVAGFRMTDIVEKKYLAQALILSEAINKENQIVCTEGIALGESLDNMPPAIDSQIAVMLGYKDKGRRYKACMNSLIECGLIFKYESKDCMIKQIDTLYYFNPVFQCAGKGVSPKLFFMFAKSFQEMAKKNKDFKYRYEQMANYAFKWMMDKRADFKQLQADYNSGKITNLQAAKGATEIFSKVADSYNIPVRLETKVDAEITEYMSSYEALMARLDSKVSYSNVNKLTAEETIEDEIDEDLLNELDASLVKEEYKKEIKVITYSDVQRTVTVNVNGRKIPVPSNPPKKLSKVNIPTLNVDVSITKPIINDYGFEEEPTYIPEQFLSM